jgi:hypothetical protein
MWSAPTRRRMSGGGKSYGGHDDVQTVFDQAILVAEFSLFPSRKNSNNHFPPPPASTTSFFFNTNTQALPTLRLLKHKQEETIHYVVHLLVYAAISHIQNVGEIMHSFL